MVRRRVLPALLLAVIAAGCGGGSGSPVQPEIESSFGELAVRSTSGIGPRPALTSSSQVVATGITGAFTSLRLRRVQPHVDEARILTSYQSGWHWRLRTVSTDGTDIRDLTTAGGDFYVTASADGRRVAFARFDPPGLHVMNANGSGLVRVTTISTDRSPALSPDGTRMLFMREVAGSPQVHEMVVATQAITQITTEPMGAFEPTYVNEPGRIVYITFDPTWRGLVKQRVLATGAEVEAARAPDNVWFYDIDVSPTREEIAIAATPAGGTDPGWILLAHPGGATGAKVQVSMPFPPMNISYSPDGDWFTVWGIQNGNRNLHVTSRATGATRPLFDFPTQPDTADWLAAPTERILIASTGASMGTAASGIIFAQDARITQSVATFRATDPSTAVVQALTREGVAEPLLVFNAEADNINSFTFVNHPAYIVRTAVGTGVSVTSAKGVLVSLDARTGLVVAALPYVGSRSSIRVEGVSGGKMLTGEFLAVLDSAGKNLAPEGAKSVSIVGPQWRVTVGP